MKSAVLFTLFPTLTFGVIVSYDPFYDNKLELGSTSTVACSDGDHGLLTKYPTFGSFKSYPYIGGTNAVDGWSSANCGKCWQLNYTKSEGSKVTNLLVIDHADLGFDTAQAAMDELTGGKAVQLGIINATASQVETTVYCGL